LSYHFGEKQELELKKTLSILLILFVLLSAFRDMVSLLSFQVNQRYIAENLCVNRDEPMTMCAGKCFFNQTIKKAHDRNESPKAPAPIEDRPTIQYLIVEQLLNQEFHFSFYKKSTFFFEKRLIGILFIFDVFHPPQK